jgi:hypothetical protein
MSKHKRSPPIYHYITADDGSERSNGRKRSRSVIQPHPEWGDRPSGSHEPKSVRQRCPWVGPGATRPTRHHLAAENRDGSACDPAPLVSPAWLQFITCGGNGRWMSVAVAVKGEWP